MNGFITASLVLSVAAQAAVAVPSSQTTVSQASAAATTTHAEPWTVMSLGSGAAQDLRLHVGAVSVRADDSQRGAAFAGGEDTFVRFVYADRSRCGLGTTSTEPEQTPRVGWRIDGRVTQRTTDGLAVRITWQRIWSDGRRAAGAAGGNLDVTMREGERLRLDTATFEPDPGCDATSVRLEAVVGRGWFSGATGVGVGGSGFGGVMGRGMAGGRGRDVASATASGSGGGGVAAGGGSGSATASAGQGGGVAGGGATSVSGGRGGSRGGVGTGGGGASATAGAVLGGGGGRGGGRGGGGGGAAGPRVTDPFDLEIWLVHVPPGGAEAVQRVAVEGMPGGTAFEFPLVPIHVLNVEISGRVTVVDDAAGKRKLTLFFSRRVVASGSTEGGSAGTRSIDMPAPDDVVSFELPDSDSQSQRLLQGHRFSLRVRIKPSK